MAHVGVAPPAATPAVTRTMARPLRSPSAPVPPVAHAEFRAEGRAVVSLWERPGKRPRKAGDAPTPAAAAAAAGFGERYLFDAPTASSAGGGGNGGGEWSLLGAPPSPPPRPSTGRVPYSTVAAADMAAFDGWMATQAAIDVGASWMTDAGGGPIEAVVPPPPAAAATPTTTATAAAAVVAVLAEAEATQVAAAAAAAAANAAAAAARKDSVDGGEASYSDRPPSGTSVSGRETPLAAAGRLTTTPHRPTLSIVSPPTYGAGRGYEDTSPLVLADAADLDASACLGDPAAAAHSSNGGESGGGGGGGVVGGGGGGGGGATTAAPPTGGDGRRRSAVATAALASALAAAEAVRAAVRAPLKAAQRPRGTAGPSTTRRDNNRISAQGARAWAAVYRSELEARLAAAVDAVAGRDARIAQLEATVAALRGGGGGAGGGGGGCKGGGARRRRCAGVCGAGLDGASCFFELLIDIDIAIFFRVVRAGDRA
ncbi:hypothetical protein BU14_0404s0015 [Porphyra umbilicalis]|uniref:Uncharacterized protein n=1 Tax=Porphyra umbilicalis TaxID=2786 RepID=A0A1X6NVZ4_PORUM|nr:hypothetical protein BU14_0404s0015 [Porphyra umbilicalis]|eukprot:OSX72788.1 hypothetical protein BU14_0404s0015 [Porphyra umbilicalis]